MNPFTSLCFSLAIILLCAPAASASEFTADMLQTMNGKPGMSGKAAVKDARMRMDVSMEGQRQIVITDPAAGKVLMLMPEAKMYMEMKLDPSQMGAAAIREDNTEEGQWRSIGKETLDGWDCELKAFDFKDKSKGELTAWFAEKLSYPIRTVYKSGAETMIMEFRNIRQEAVAPAQFAVPAGYQRLNMPAMGQGMPPGMAPGKNPGMGQGMGKKPPM
ncbi:MAG: hypothetical protein FD177_2853 [Desulfovibrionaceae bacterium]|nr:MAG: hypothetical protein FD177_2853 [Desulfovibrionaceae bacterium]